jgi:hypothetical protein
VSLSSPLSPAVAEIPSAVADDEEEDEEAEEEESEAADEDEDEDEDADGKLFCSDDEADDEEDEEEEEEEEWVPLRYRYLPSTSHSPCVFVAPHHPRVDHNAYYEGCKQRAAHFNYLDPYHTEAMGGGALYGRGWLQRMCTLLLCGDQDVHALFAGWVADDRQEEGNKPEGGVIRIRAVTYECRFVHPAAAQEAWFTFSKPRVHMAPFSLRAHTDADMFVLPQSHAVLSRYWRQTMHAAQS